MSTLPISSRMETKKAVHFCRRRQSIVLLLVMRRLLSRLYLLVGPRGSSAIVPKKVSLNQKSVAGTRSREYPRNLRAKRYRYNAATRSVKSPPLFPYIPVRLARCATNSTRWRIPPLNMSARATMITLWSWKWLKATGGACPVSALSPRRAVLASAASSAGYGCAHPAPGTSRFPWRTPTKLNKCK